MEPNKTQSLFLYLSLDETDLAYNRQGLMSPAQRQRIVASMTKTVTVFGVITLLVIAFILTMLFQNETSAGDKISLIAPAVILYIPIFWLIMRPSLRMLINARREEQIDPVETILHTKDEGVRKIILLNNRQAQTIIKPELFGKIQSGKLYHLYIAHLTRNIVGAEPVIVE